MLLGFCLCRNTVEKMKRYQNWEDFRRSNKCLSASRWVVGEGGTILHTTTGGGPMDIGDAILSPLVPKECLLTQNFPNPFNSVTTIHYELPKTTYVRLAVYSVLGKEIKVLVSGSQFLSGYRVNWDGRNQSGELFASGIFIWELITDSFIERKKLLLLR